VFRRGDVVLSGAEADEVSRLYSEAKVDRKMKSVNTFLNAVNDVLVAPVFRGGKLCLDILTPDRVIVVPDEDDPSKIGKLMIPKMRMVAGKYQRYWTVWTDSEHYLEVEATSYTSSMINTRVSVTYQEALPDNPNMINPYGVIPFVDLHRYQSEFSFWDETSGDDIYQLNKVVGCRNTLLDYASAWQSFKQVALKSPQKPEGKPVIGPSTALWSTDGEWSVLDLHADFNAVRNDLKALVSQVSQNYGVTLESFNAPSQQSGVALKINNQELSDNWSDQIEIMMDGEERLWEMIKLVAEVDQISSGLKDITIEIKYPTMSITDDKEELENDEKKMQLGIMSPGEAYMKWNPSVIDEREATEKMRENLQNYSDIKPSPTKYVIMDNSGDGKEKAGEGFKDESAK